MSLPNNSVAFIEGVFVSWILENFGIEDFRGLTLYFDIYLIFLKIEKTSNMIREYIISCYFFKYQKIDLTPKYNSQRHSSSNL